MGLVYAEHLLRMLGMFSFFLHLLLVCFYHKNDLSLVIVVFPMTITNAELDDGSVQMLHKGFYRRIAFVRFSPALCCFHYSTQGQHRYMEREREHIFL